MNHVNIFFAWIFLRRDRKHLHNQAAPSRHLLPEAHARTGSPAPKPYCASSTAEQTNWNKERDMMRSIKIQMQITIQMYMYNSGFTWILHRWNHPTMHSKMQTMLYFKRLFLMRFVQYFIWVRVFESESWASFSENFTKATLQKMGHGFDPRTQTTAGRR